MEEEYIAKIRLLQKYKAEVSSKFQSTLESNFLINKIYENIFPLVSKYSKNICAA